MPELTPGPMPKDTVKVVAPFAEGFMLINKEDFVEGTHEIFVEVDPFKAPEAPEAKPSKK
jgi:hypothetical protein